MRKIKRKRVKLVETKMCVKLLNRVFFKSDLCISLFTSFHPFIKFLKFIFKNINHKMSLKSRRPSKGSFILISRLLDDLNIVHSPHSGASDCERAMSLDLLCKLCWNHKGGGYVQNVFLHLWCIQCDASRPGVIATGTSGKLLASVNDTGMIEVWPWKLRFLLRATDRHNWLYLYVHLYLGYGENTSLLPRSTEEIYVY